MKQESRETMVRAIGIIEGVSFVAACRVRDALAAVVDMLDGVLNDEPSEHFAKE